MVGAEDEIIMKFWAERIRILRASHQSFGLKVLGYYWFRVYHQVLRLEV